MGCRCGSQVVLCNMPVRFDTYKGCSHGCRYCFVQKKTNLNEIEPDETPKRLLKFINGERGTETKWCDWNIPIHWGGMSDPFQPIEKKYRVSYECLKILAETQYPFVVSTKGGLVIDPEYLELLSKCNCVVQISAVCSSYDKLEKGCPSYTERLQIAAILAKQVKRVIIRIQPYMHEVFAEVLSNIPKIAQTGAYGIILEGMKFYKAKEGMVKIGADTCYPIEILRRDFETFKLEAHRNNLRFYCGENRLRAMGDDMTCCGIEGLDGFKPNEYNICMLINGKKPEATERMKEIGTAGAFKTIYQTAGSSRQIRQQSFYGMMQNELISKPEYYKTIFGVGDSLK